MENKNSQKDKWEMFKNYMHNELGVTKDDIRAWIKEAVQIEAEKLINQSFGSFDTKQLVKMTIEEYFSDRRWDKDIVKREVVRIAAEELVKKLSVQVNGKGQ